MHLQYNKIRYLLSLSITLFIAAVITYFGSITHSLLIPFLAIYMMQTSIGNPIFQSMQKLILVFFILILFALLIHSMSYFYLIAHDVLIGALIGIIANVIFPLKQPDIEFCNQIIPVLRQFNLYFNKIMDQVLQQKAIDASDNITFEKTLLRLPDWVYERGFSQTLQTGYQFFLMKIEHTSDNLFAMHHLARFPYEKEFIAKLRPTFLQYIDNVNQFFNSLATVLNLKTLQQAPPDLEMDLLNLENHFFSIVPNSLELIDMREDYINLAALVYNLKDLNKNLIMMGEALR